MRDRGQQFEAAPPFAALDPLQLRLAAPSPPRKFCLRKPGFMPV
jgi:hypothetical protein